MRTIHVKRLVVREVGRELWHYDRIWATELREFLSYWKARPHVEIYYRRARAADIWTRVGR